VVVDTDIAYKNFAATLGKTVEQLTQAEKREATQQATLKALADGARRAGEGVQTFSRQVKEMGVEIWNAVSAAAAWANTGLGKLFGSGGGGKFVMTEGDISGWARGAAASGEAEWERRLREAGYGGAPRLGSRSMRSPSELGAGRKTWKPSDERALEALAKTGTRQRGREGGFSPYEQTLDVEPFSGAGKMGGIGEAIGEESIKQWDEFIGQEEAARNSTSRLADAFGALNEQWRSGQQAAREFQSVQAQLADAKMWEGLRNVGVGALADLASGMWAAADAAIVGQESFGMAMAKMTKSTLLSIAAQATVKAVFELAEGTALLWTGVGAGIHFKAAALYAAVAALAGGGGLAMSYGIGQAGGYDRQTSGRSERTSSESTRPSYGQTVKETNPVFYVNLYIEGSKNAAALALGDRILKSTVERQAA